MHLNRFTQALKELDTMYVWSHFADDQVDTSFVDTVTDTGTVLMGDDVGGIVTLTPSDGTVADNDEAYIATPNELFKFGTSRTIYGRAKLKFTEVTAAKVNIAFGFQNAVGANSIVDDGGGLKVSGSTLGIYTIDGGSNLLRVVSSCNGTSTVTITNKTVAAATWYVFEIECKDNGTGVTMDVLFKVDGDYLRDSNNLPIKHTVLIASATEMQMFAGVKLGAATNNDTLLLDYWYGSTCEAP